MLCCLPLERKQRSIPILPYWYSLCHTTVFWWIPTIIAFFKLLAAHTGVLDSTNTVLLRVPVRSSGCIGEQFYAFLVLCLACLSRQQTFWAEALFSWVRMHCLAQSGRGGFTTALPILIPTVAASSCTVLSVRHPPRWHWAVRALTWGLAPSQRKRRFTPHSLSVPQPCERKKNTSQWSKESDLSKWEITIFGEYLER